MNILKTIPQLLVRGLFLFTILIQCGHSLAQRQINGVVTDLITGITIEGASIVNFTTGAQTISDSKGNFTISITKDSSHLRVKAKKYFDEQRTVFLSDSFLEIGMLLDTDNLREVVLVGSRFKPRSIANSPVPIDNISKIDLRSAGHYDLDMMMMYNIPSFNSSYQTVSDATAHMNPADLRGLGPSRTLILINGKRKNYSSLVYINDTPGKGEVGVDLTSIPSAAIERIEILRDGASANYGSDAIAGVVNIVLKENADYAEVNNLTGVYQEGDGFVSGFDAHFGSRLGTKGSINISASYKKQEETNRSPSLDEDLLFGITPSNPNSIRPIILSQHLDWISKHPDLGMKVGQPEMTTNNLFFNSQFAISDNTTLYAFGGSSIRGGRSYALFRTPYWVNDYGIYNREGFHPDFQTDIHDNTLTIGGKGMIGDWQFDISTTRGSNSMDYTIGNTLNDSLQMTSPTRFEAGGYKFDHTVNNLDFSRTLGQVDIGAGFEFRHETFITSAGEEASYLGSGSISFPGIQPTNEVDESRNNFSIYADINIKLIPNLMVGGAIRYEDYSDFGNRVNWKTNGKFDIIDNFLSIRGSISTGFRAPSLHQIHLSNIQTIVSGNTVSNQGTFKNNSTVLRSFDIPNLKEETSVNISAGITLTPMSTALITADVYDIKVDDRIVFTGAIGDDGDPFTNTQVEQLLSSFSITSFKFFTNAISTRTQGIDLVLNRSHIDLGGGVMGVSIGANFNKTKLDGPIQTSQILENEGNSLFDRKEISRIETSRPSSKVIVGINYEIKKIEFQLNNVRFGEVTWRNAIAPGTIFEEDYFNFSQGDIAPNWDQTFSSKIITDLNIGYNINTKAKISIGSNNLLNVYPDKIDSKGDITTDLAGRFTYPWEVNQFGFNGRFYYAKFNLTF